MFVGQHTQMHPTKKLAHVVGRFATIARNRREMVIFLQMHVKLVKQIGVFKAVMIAIMPHFRFDVDKLQDAKTKPAEWKHCNRPPPVRCGAQSAVPRTTNVHQRTVSRLWDG